MLNIINQWIKSEEERESGISFWYQNGVNLSKFGTTTYLPRLLPILRPKTKGKDEKSFADLLQRLGLYENFTLINPPADKKEFSISRDARFIWTNGEIIQENNGKSFVRNFSFFVEYRLSEIHIGYGKLLKIVSQKASRPVVFRILAKQIFGVDIPQAAIDAVINNDWKQAKQLVNKNTFSPSTLLLYLNWKNEDKESGQIPIVDQKKLPPLKSPGYIMLLWQFFGLKAFEGQSFNKTLSPKQKDLQAVLEKNSIEEALEYLFNYNKLIAFMRKEEEGLFLAIDGIPQKQALLTRSDFTLLFRHFGESLVERILNHPNIGDRYWEIPLRRPSDIYLNEKQDEWIISKQGTITSLKVKGSLSFDLSSSEAKNENFCYALKKLELQGLKAKGSFHFPKGAKILGALFTGNNGYLKLDRSSIILFPKEQKMFVALWVKEDYYDMDVYGCFLNPIQERPIKRFVRKITGKPMSYQLELVEQQELQNVVTGIDELGEPWAFEPVENRYKNPM